MRLGVLLMAGTLAPTPWFTGLDSAGVTLPGAKLFTYLAGTTTKTTTWTDVGQTSANTNPIILDSAGRATVFLASNTSYKFVLAPSTDSDPPVSPIKTQDNIGNIPANTVNTDILGMAGEAIADQGTVLYLSAGDGGRTAGRWYKADADLTYASVTANGIGVSIGPAVSPGGSITVRTAGRSTSGHVGLLTGSVYYVSAAAGSLTDTPPTNARPVGVADSTTSIVLSQFVPIPDAAQTWGGRVTSGDQAIGGVKTFHASPLFVPMGAAGAVGRLGGGINANTTTVGNVGTGQDDLMTFSVPALVLVNNGQAIRITAWGTYAANGNTKRVRCYFGATAIADSTAQVINGGSWHVAATVIRTGAATQTAGGHIALTDGTGSSDARTVTTAPAETLSGAVTVKCTGEATANNDVVQSGMIVETVG